MKKGNKITKEMDRRIHRIVYWDLSIIKAAVAVFIFMLVSLVPEITTLWSLNVTWYMWGILFVILAVVPIKDYWFVDLDANRFKKKRKHTTKMLSQKMKEMRWFDIGLTKGAIMAFWLMVLSAYPDAVHLWSLNVQWYVWTILFLMLAAIPFYHFYIEVPKIKGNG